MSKKASEILSRMKEVAARERAKPPEEITPQDLARENPVPRLPAGASPTPSGKRKTVRFTVDLDPELHRFLRIYALEQGVRGSEVLRALLEELGSDPELQASIQRRLHG